MTKILVPMDLTEVSVNAMRYAYDMFPDAAFHIISVFSGQSTREPFYLKPGTTKEMILEEELANHVKAGLEVSKLPDNITIEIAKGEIIPSVKAKAEEIQPDYIVTGTRDKYNLIDKWIGTISLGIVKSVDCPTYLVPRHATYHKMSKVLMATDHQLEDSKLIHWLMKWNKEQQAFVKFLHVQDTENKDLQSISEKIVSNLFEEEDANFGFEISNIKSKEITDTVLDTAYNMGADLVIAAPDRQSLFNTMLYKSISKELILKSKIPLLFLKYAAKEEA